MRGRSEGGNMNGKHVKLEKKSLGKKKKLRGGRADVLQRVKEESRRPRRKGEVKVTGSTNNKIDV